MAYADRTDYLHTLSETAHGIAPKTRREVKRQYNRVIRKTAREQISTELDQHERGGIEIHVINLDDMWDRQRCGTVISCTSNKRRTFVLHQNGAAVWESEEGRLPGFDNKPLGAYWGDNDGDVINPLSDAVMEAMLPMLAEEYIERVEQHLHRAEMDRIEDMIERWKETSGYYGW